MIRRKLLSMAVTLTALTIGRAQETTRPQSSFTLTLSELNRDAVLGAPITLKVVLTNVSDHDVMIASTPNSESKTKANRQIDLKVHDTEGKAIPQTRHGRRILGRDPDQTMSVTVFSFPMKPGKTLTEEADLTEEFELHKPGSYTVQAERFDPYSKVLVKSNVITITVVQ